MFAHQAVFLLLAAGAISQARHLLAETSKDFEKPWFCHDLDCPKYKVLNTTDKYEIREYEGATFATTSVESLVYTIGVTDGFKRLFQYISGKNEDNEKIEMTSPVVTKTTPGQGPFCKSNFTTFFYLPYTYQKHPPTPSNPDVSIVHTHKRVVAVLQFGGFVAEEWTLSHKIKLLEDALDEDGIKYISAMISASYDPPFRLQHRHNEVWVALERDEVSLPQIIAQ